MAGLRRDAHGGAGQGGHSSRADSAHVVGRVRDARPSRLQRATGGRWLWVQTLTTTGDSQEVLVRVTWK